MHTFILKYKYKLLIFVCLLTVACQSEKKTIPPEDLIPKNKMALILADILLLENHYINIMSDSDQTNYDELQFYSPSLINEKYRLKDSQAYYSYQYYISQPKLFQEILDLALDSLNQLAEQNSLQLLEP